jgi:hypothetical protein
MIVVDASVAMEILLRTPAAARTEERVFGLPPAFPPGRRLGSLQLIAADARRGDAT